MSAGNSFISRWFKFVLERFAPLAHLLMITAFFSACGILGLRIADTPFAFNWRLIPAFAATVFIFLHMRIFDEIKDYEHDIEVNPTRPLARGLISVYEAKVVAYFLIVIELALTALLGMQAFVSGLCVVVYTLVMYKEFFIGEWLRPLLAIYALFHTVVAGWIALFVFSALTGLYLWEAPLGYWLFVLASYFIFNIFEFGRKTFAPEEERSGVESYSRNFGLWRATLNVSFLQAIPSVAIAIYLGINLGLGLTFNAAMAVLALAITVSGIVLAAKPTTGGALVFRGICSAFIVLFNLIIATAAGVSL